MPAEETSPQARSSWETLSAEVIDFCRYVYISLYHKSTSITYAVPSEYSSTYFNQQKFQLNDSTSHVPLLPHYWSHTIDFRDSLFVPGPPSSLFRTWRDLILYPDALFHGPVLGGEVWVESRLWVAGESSGFRLWGGVEKGVGEVCWFLFELGVELFTYWLS